MRTLTNTSARIFFIIFGAVAIDYAGVGMMRTLFPYLARQHSESAALIGGLESAYGVGQVCGSLILGRLSDRIGRRTVLLLSITGSAVGYGMAGAAPSAIVLLASRLPVGLAKQTVTISRAALADITEGSARSAAMAWLTASCGVGYAIGPLFGAAIAERFGEHNSAYVAASIFLILLPFVALCLPETSPLVKSKSPWGLLKRFRALQKLDQSFSRAMIIIALPEIAIISFSTTVLSALSVKELGQSKLWLGSINTAMGIGNSLVSALVLPLLSSRLGDLCLLRWGYIAYACACGILAWMPTPQVVQLSVLPFSLGIAVIRSTPAAFLSRRMPSDVQGEALGMLDAISSLLRVFIPLIFGMLIDAAGCPAALFLEFAFCSGAAALIDFMSPPIESRPDGEKED